MSTAPSPFQFGVASGDVSDSEVVLWARVASPGASVSWFCQADDDTAQPTTGTVLSDSKTGSIHVKVEGLASGSRYRYWFEADGQRSTEGRFRTIPVDR